jgi:hypothetical protein
MTNDECTMTIRFRCPNPACKKVLGVPDHLAGRKANCPACKKPFRIPAQRAAPGPGLSVEEEAAAAFAEEPAAAAAAPAEKPQTIQLECPFCLEQVEFSAEMGGKRAPCPNPECRRIVSVPALKVEKQADWRRAGRDGLQGTRENVVRVLEAQKAANIKTSVVSRQALEEAGALPTRVEVLTTEEKVRRWIRRGAIVAVVLAVAAVAWIWFNWERKVARQTDAVAEVVAWLDPKDAGGLVDAEERKKLLKDGPRVAELYRALGDFYLRDQLKPKESLDKARKVFIGARAMLPPNKAPTPEWEILLADLAVSQVELGGSSAQVQDKERMDWSEVKQELSRTLGKIASVEGRLMALRQLGGRLIERGQGAVAVALATELATGGKGVGKGAKGPPPELRGAQVALLLALNQAAQAAKELPPPKEGAAVDLATRLGYAEGQAWAGNFDQARKVAQQQGHPRERLLASLGVADIALQKGQSAAATANLNDAIALLSKELRNARLHPLVLFQAARVAARAGQAVPAKAVLAALSADRAVQTRAELELLLRRIEDREQADADAVITDKKSLAYAQGLEAVARSKAAQGQRDEVLQQADQLEEKQLRPFLLMGVALGDQDRELGKQGRSR